MSPPNVASTPSAGIPLTRQEKEKLLRKMYTSSHWIALIRLFGYRRVPMDQAREEIGPLAKEFGQEPVASACEALVEIKAENERQVAYLKPHVLRMAFQILGPEREPDNREEKAGRPPRRQPKKAESKNVVKTPLRPAAKTDGPTPETRSPIMQQYRAAKERHPGMLLLFRMGDFYELFEEDAEGAHRLLGLTLTTRDRTVPMAGFPHHQLEAYLHKLLNAGKRVAICEPVEESLARGPIRREVTRVVTPGSIVEDASTDTEPVRKPKHSTARHGSPVRQPRHFVIKQYEAWLRANGLTFVAAEEAQRTTPAVAPYAAVLDFIVLQRDEKRLVTVRPQLQAKHLKAIRELLAHLGAQHEPVRIWPEMGEDGWIWQEFPVDDLPGRPS